MACSVGNSVRIQSPPSNLRTFEPSNLQTFKPSNLRTFQPSNLPTFQPSKLRSFESSKVQTFELSKRRSVEASKRRSVEASKRPSFEGWNLRGAAGELGIAHQNTSAAPKVPLSSRSQVRSQIRMGVTEPNGNGGEGGMGPGFRSFKVSKPR